VAQTTTNVARIKRAHAFLAERESTGTTFTVADLATATGWKPGSIRTYLTKKWSKIIKREGKDLRVSGVSTYTTDEFVRLMSQKDEISAEPKKPQLKPEVEALLRKARESALLALQVYNNPTTVFKTEGFSVLMVIAWTALLHGIFERRGERYVHLDAKTQQPIMIDGDEKAWELAECVSHFYGGSTTPARKNLEFFIRLRNKIEHRFVPEIDPHLAGECQALLFNFDDLLVTEFGSFFAIRDSLAVALHTAHVRGAATDAAMRKFQAKHFGEVMAFVSDFRGTLAPEVHGDQSYRFSVFLIPKPANHRGGADYAIEFVKVTPENEGKLAELTKSIVAIKERTVHVANAGHFKPSDVVKRVATRLGKPFNTTHHTRAWQRYKVRPAIKGGKATTNGCDPRFCIADEVHNDYVYTAAWIDHLVKTLSDETEYLALTKTKAPKSG
jgi:hypothetical protein